MTRLFPRSKPPPKMLTSLVGMKRPHALMVTARNLVHALTSPLFEISSGYMIR